MKKFQFLTVLIVALLLLGIFLGDIADLQQRAGETQARQQGASLDQARSYRQYELGRDNRPLAQANEENPAGWFDRRLPELPKNVANALPGWYNDSENQRMILVIKQGTESPGNLPACPRRRTIDAPWPNACTMVLP